MLKPFGTVVFEYFHTLIESIPAIQAQIPDLENKNSIELEIELEITEERLDNARKQLAVEEEKEKLLKTEKKNTQQELLEVRREAESIHLPTEDDCQKLLDVTNQLQRIHEKSDLVASLDDMIDNTKTRRFTSLENNNFKEIIEYTEECESIADKLVNRHR